MPGIILLKQFVMQAVGIKPIAIPIFVVSFHKFPIQFSVPNNFQFIIF